MATTVPASTTSAVFSYKRTVALGYKRGIESLENSNSRVSLLHGSPVYFLRQQLSFVTKSADNEYYITFYVNQGGKNNYFYMEVSANGNPEIEIFPALAESGICSLFPEDNLKYINVRGPSGFSEAVADKYKKESFDKKSLIIKTDPDGIARFAFRIEKTFSEEQKVVLYIGPPAQSENCFAFSPKIQCMSKLKNYRAIKVHERNDTLIKEIVIEQRYPDCPVPEQEKLQPHIYEKHVTTTTVAVAAAVAAAAAAAPAPSPALVPLPSFSDPLYAIRAFSTSIFATLADPKVQVAPTAQAAQAAQVAFSAGSKRKHSEVASASA